MKTLPGVSMVLCLLCALPSWAAQPEKVVTPVPVGKEALDGTRLRLKTGGCSLDLPGPGWAWMTYEKAGERYLCTNTRTQEIYVVSVGELKGEMTDHQPQSLIDNARRSEEAHGGKVEREKYEFLEMPGAKKSARVTFCEIEKSGTQFAYIYLINTVDKALLKIHCTGAYTAEPEPFKKMVKSLKLFTEAGDAKPGK